MLIAKKRSVLIVSGQHFATQPRRVDLHFMADALARRGDHVDFFSVRLSRWSSLVKDPRWSFARSRPLNRWTSLGEDRAEFIKFDTLHPINLRFRLLNSLARPLWKSLSSSVPREVLSRLPYYTEVLIESGMALLLLEEIRKNAPQAQIIYHAADRLATIGAHPMAQDVLTKQSDKIDLVRLVAEDIRADIPPGRPTLYLQHGIEKSLFDDATVSPYERPNNAISVGDMLFDGQAVEAMALENPDWTFHLFGAKASLSRPFENVVTHGERPFKEIAPFVRFADVGIAPYAGDRGADYISQSSIKMIQYSYCRLPMVAPQFAAAGRDHVSSYDPGDQASIRAAFKRAISYDRSLIVPSSVLSWDEVVERLFPN